MELHSSTSSSKNLSKRRLRAWGIALAIVVVIEVIVDLAVPILSPIDQGARFYSAGTRPSFTASLVQWQTMRARQLKESADLIFIGDSSCTLGIIPEIIDHGSKHHSENLCLLQWVAIDGQVDLLRRYLKTHTPPAAVAYYFSDGVLGMSAPLFDRLGMRTPYRRWLGYEEGPMAWWPSTRLRTKARALIGGQWYQETSNDTGVRTFMEKHRGFLREPRSDDPGIITIPSLPMHPDNIPGLVRLFRLTAKNNIELLLMHAPVSMTSLGTHDRSEIEQNQALMQAMITEYTNVTIAWPFSYGVPKKFFRDYEHLTILGAQYNSEYISAWLRNHGH